MSNCRNIEVNHVHGSFIRACSLRLTRIHDPAGVMVRPGFLCEQGCDAWLSPKPKVSSKLPPKLLFRTPSPRSQMVGTTRRTIIIIFWIEKKIIKRWPHIHSKKEARKTIKKNTEEKRKILPPKTRPPQKKLKKNKYARFSLFPY